VCVTKLTGICGMFGYGNCEIYISSKYCVRYSEAFGNSNLSLGRCHTKYVGHIYKYNIKVLKRNCMWKCERDL